MLELFEWPQNGKSNSPALSLFERINLATSAVALVAALMQLSFLRLGALI